MAVANPVFSPGGYRTQSALGRVRKVRRMGAIEDSDWSSNLTNFLTAAQTAYTTNRLLDLNIQRAQQGLAPISAQSVAPTVNFGVSTDTQKMLLYGAIALGVVLLLRKR
jgi:hypothetical protein